MCFLVFGSLACYQHLSPQAMKNDDFLAAKKQLYRSPYFTLSVANLWGQALQIRGM